MLGRQVKLGLMTVVGLGLLACQPIQTQPKKENSDYGPKQAPEVSHIPQPTPWNEPRKRAGNSSPYTVLGQTYQLIENPVGYSAVGGASWYGKKFHGRKTANGETYNMYAYTAAHKTLPIPSYVKVTRLDTQKSIIVRINDRGPFHPGRIIDLSYTAADALDIIHHGTGKVRVEYIDTTPKPKPNTINYNPAKATYNLQLGVFSNYQSAHQLTKKVQVWDTALKVDTYGNHQQKFRVIVTNLASDNALATLQARLVNAGFPKGFTVKDAK